MSDKSKSEMKRKNVLQGKPIGEGIGKPSPSGVDRDLLEKCLLNARGNIQTLISLKESSRGDVRLCAGEALEEIKLAMKCLETPPSGFDVREYIKTIRNSVDECVKYLESNPKGLTHTEMSVRNTLTQLVRSMSKVEASLCNTGEVDRANSVKTLSESDIKKWDNFWNAARIEDDRIQTLTAERDEAMEESDQWKAWALTAKKALLCSDNLDLVCDALSDFPGGDDE
jgi:hypothetical protein